MAIMMKAGQIRHFIKELDDDDWVCLTELHQERLNAKGGWDTPKTEGCHCDNDE